MPLFQFCQEESEGLWSHISLVGLQIKTSEATGVQTQDVDTLSATFFLKGKLNSKNICTNLKNASPHGSHF